MLKSSGFAALLAAGLVAALPGTAEASFGTIQCTPGALRTCAYVDLSRSGSTFTLRVQNLQGDAWFGDNTGGSSIFGISLLAAPGFSFSGSAFPAVAIIGGTVTHGNPLFAEWFATASFTGGSIDFLGFNSAIEGLSGVRRADPDYFTYQTSGGFLNSLVEFTFDADFDLRSFAGWGFVAETASGDFVGCNLGGSDFEGFSAGACQPDVVPEPMTITLLGTGLAGMGAAARRRKQATTTTTDA